MPTTDYARTEIDRLEARSMTITSTGIVAAEHPLAAQAGAMILAQGGHAVDAAIAANAVMGVVAPLANGVGGDLFATVYDAATDQLHGVNASGWAPSGLTPDALGSAGASGMPQQGIHSVTVPGAVAGWALLRDRFGRLPLGDLLAAAIDLAEHGFPVSELVSAEWAGSDAHLRAHAGAAATYLPAGRTPRVGERFSNVDLAWTLSHIAAAGRAAFYAGDVAQRILATSRQLGGHMTAADLSEFDAEWVAPVSTTYRGWTVSELPPNGQGVAALMMLNLIEAFPIGEYGHQSADALHTMIEAKKLAYADMSRLVADPRFTSIPIDDMLSKTYARERLSLIGTSARAHTPPGRLPRHGGDTTYLCTVDRAGNMVSLIQSNFANFGSGVVPGGTGFALQNRGGLFTLDPAHPNVLAPRKRPLHTIIPGFMSRGDVRVAFGIMGGWNQAQAHVQFVSNVVDHGLNIQASLEAARFTKLSFEGCDVLMENRIPAATRAELSARGHHVEVCGRFSNMVGGGQSVMRDASTSVNFGASDPRKDGAAIPEPIVA